MGFAQGGKTQPLTDEQLKEALEASEKHDTNQQAADSIGLSLGTFRKRLRKARARFEEPALEESAQRVGYPIDDVKHYWIKENGISAFVKRSGQPQSYMEMRDEIIATMDAHSPRYDPIEPVGGDHLLVMDPADVHIGKLSAVLETGADYDMGIAVDRIRSGVTGLLGKAIGHGIGRIIVVIGNDILHIDNPRRTTTSGTPQDTHGQWWQMFAEAKKCYVAMIEQLASVAPVHVIFCPSNHDYVSGWMLADTLASWFRQHEGVSFGIEDRSVSIAHRKYAVFSNALLGFTHGDGAKEKDLPMLMQHEAREAWGRTKYSYWYVHHFHHKIRNASGKHSQRIEKDHAGVTVIQSGQEFDPTENTYVEYVRSPSPADGWHDRNGYKNSQSIECYLHDETGWQCSRFSHVF